MVTQDEILEYVKSSNKEVVKRTEITAEMRKRYPKDTEKNLCRKITARIHSLVSWQELEQVKKPKLYNQRYTRGELFYRATVKARN